MRSRGPVYLIVPSNVTLTEASDNQMERYPGYRPSEAELFIEGLLARMV